MIFTIKNDKFTAKVDTLGAQIISLEDAQGRELLWTGDPAPFHGDFVSPEQIIPPNGIQDKNGRDMVWEACVTG